MFRDKKYLLQLYQALHPEDTETTEEDLTEYLKAKESKVVSIMMELFDEEYIQRAYHQRIVNETTEEVTEKVTEEVTEKVTKEVTKEVTEKAMAAVVESAVKMLKSGRIKMEEISEFFPQINEENIKNIQQMFCQNAVMK